METLDLYVCFVDPKSEHKWRVKKEIIRGEWINYDPEKGISVG
jgi:hypothetical protein